MFTNLEGKSRHLLRALHVALAERLPSRLQRQARDVAVNYAGSEAAAAEAARQLRRWTQVP